MAYVSVAQKKNQPWIITKMWNDTIKTNGSLHLDVFVTMYGICAIDTFDTKLNAMAGGNKRMIRMWDARHGISRDVGMVWMINSCRKNRVICNYIRECMW